MVLLCSLFAQLSRASSLFIIPNVCLSFPAYIECEGTLEKVQGIHVPQIINNNILEQSL